MKVIIRGINRFSDLTGKFLSYFLLVLVGLLVFAVVMRYIFNQPVIWVHETTMFIYGAIGVMIGGYTAHHGMHVRMDLFYNKWSPRLRGIMNAITAPIFFLFIILIIVKGWDQFQWAFITQQRTDSMWHPLLWPAKFTVIIGGFFILLQGIADFASAIYSAVTGKVLQ